MHLSPQSSPMTLVSSRLKKIPQISPVKFPREHRQRGRRVREAGLPCEWEFPWEWEWDGYGNCDEFPWELWEFCGNFWSGFVIEMIVIGRSRFWISSNTVKLWMCFNGIFEFFLHYIYIFIFIRHKGSNDIRALNTIIRVVTTYLSLYVSMLIILMR